MRNGRIPPILVCKTAFFEDSTMLGLQKILETVNKYKDPSVDRALSLALDTSDAQSSTDITKTLLNRHEHHAMHSLVVNYHKATPQMKKEIAFHGKNLHQALRQTIKSNHTQTIANGITLIWETKSAQQAYLLNDVMLHGKIESKQLAAMALFKLAGWATSGVPYGDPICSAEDFQAIRNASLDAVKNYHAHQLEKTLESLYKFLSSFIPGLLKTMHEPHMDIVLPPMRKALATLQSDEIAAGCVQFLDHPHFKAAALRGLRHASDHNMMQPILRSHHLLKIASKRSELKELVDAKHLIPPQQILSEYDQDAAIGYLQWVETLIGLELWTIPYLKAAHNLKSATARLHALRALMKMASKEKSATADKAILYFIADKNPHVATTAARYTLNHHEENEKEFYHLLLELLHSQHLSVRRLASIRLAPIGFDSIWNNWHKISEQQRTTLGQTLIKIDPNFHHMLGRKLGSENPSDTVKALAIINFLNQGDFFTQAITILLRSQNEKIASAAATAIGTTTAPQSIEHLERTLLNKNARVRANAIESLNKLEAKTHFPTLQKIAQKDKNRPRANAIGALMEQHTDEALNALEVMLSDEAANHRTSALWLIEHMGLIDMAKHVAEMSISDPDPTVRNKAKDVIDKIITQIHHTDTTDAQKQEAR